MLLWTIGNDNGRLTVSAGEILGKHDGKVAAVAFSHDSKFVASCGGDKNSIFIRAAQPNAPVSQVLPLSDSVTCVAWEPTTGHRLVSVSGPLLGTPTIRIWDWKRGKVVQKFCQGPAKGDLPARKGPAGLVPCLVFSRDGEKIIAGSWDGNIYVWSSAEGNSPESQPAPRPLDSESP